MDDNLNKKPESKSINFLSLSLGSFLVTAITVIMVLMCLNSLLSMGWGLDFYDFSNRVILPIFWLGTFIAVILCQKLIKNFRQTGTFLSNKKLLVSFILTFTIPLILILIYSSMDKIQRNVYLNGMTPDSCAKGKPSVPWGKFAEGQRCYSLIGRCDLITDPNAIKDCLEISNFFHPNSYSEYSDCNKLQSGKDICMVKIAADKKDISFCKSTVNKVGCLETIFDNEFLSIRARVSPYNNLEKSINMCNSYGGGIKTDYCLLQSAKYNQNNKQLLCDTVSNDNSWLKSECLNIK